MIIMEEMMMENSIGDHLVTIYRVMNQKTFGFRFSAAIVGGRSRLERLIAQGKIRAEKKSNSKEASTALRISAPSSKYVCAGS